MRKALVLAAKGLGQCSPNPAVGAVLVKNDRNIGNGYHQKAGLAHAEVNALKDCLERGNDPRGATMYITLEPCCHHGKTPPCTDLLIKNKICRVFIATTDPNPLVDGRGIAQLKKNGIEICTPLLETEAKMLNVAFFKHLTEKLPWFIIKGGTSIDGKISANSGQSRWITGVEARKKVQHLRATMDGILAGWGTVKKDNPNLTLRIKGKRKRWPVRIILSSELSFAPGLNIFKDLKKFPTRIYTLEKSLARAKRTKNPLLGLQGLTIIPCATSENGWVNLLDVAVDLHKNHLHRILIEGGGEINASFLNAGLVDEIHHFLAPLIIGGRSETGLGANFFAGEGIEHLKDATQLYLHKSRRAGTDIWQTYYLRKF
ncbi:bifunctional diaminohydroxyphosphoribosylaminopyrimidine deaminase/5-amino-6-(5-phosphoribosylamino)uracil reductase RibD [Candidatus Riflebacteria bacterium]